MEVNGIDFLIVFLLVRISTAIPVCNSDAGKVEKNPVYFSKIKWNYFLLTEEKYTLQYGENIARYCTAFLQISPFTSNWWYLVT